MENISFNKRLQESFVRNWGLPALSNYQGITLTYSDIARRISKLHIAFEQCGLHKGDKVALCSRSQANWGVCFLASLTYGAVPVPLQHEFKPSMIQHLVNHSEARVLFVDDAVWKGLDIAEMPGVSVVVNISDLNFLFAASDEYMQVREHLNELYGKRYPKRFEKEDIKYYEDTPDELAIINYTSGTSGQSKGVMIPYRALSSNVDFAHFDALPRFGQGSQVVSMLPMAHMYGFMFEFMFQMTMGAHVHFITKMPTPKLIMQAFADIHPDIIISVPLIIEKIYKNKLKPILDKNKLLFRIPIVDQMIEGAAFNNEVERFFRKIGFRFTVGYGMTECAPIICYAHWNNTRMFSCGKVVRNMQLRIDSPDPEKIAGEVQVKGANVFLGYFKNEEATQQVFTEDGWFRTGDMGVVDSDGYLYLKGRCKCMILGPSGQNIYPEELESVLNNLTYVTESLVVDDHGVLTALIYPDYQQAEQDGIGCEALENMIRDWLPSVNKELPSYASIQKIEFMHEDFERTPKRSIKRYLYQKK